MLRDLGRRGGRGGEVLARDLHDKWPNVYFTPFWHPVSGPIACQYNVTHVFRLCACPRRFWSLSFQQSFAAGPSHAETDIILVGSPPVESATKQRGALESDVLSIEIHFTNGRHGYRRIDLLIAVKLALICTIRSGDFAMAQKQLSRHVGTVYPVHDLPAWLFPLQPEFGIQTAHAYSIIYIILWVLTLEHWNLKMSSFRVMMCIV